MNPYQKKKLRAQLDEMYSNAEFLYHEAYLQREAANTELSELVARLYDLKLSQDPTYPAIYKQYESTLYMMTKAIEEKNTALEYLQAQMQQITGKLAQLGRRNVRYQEQYPQKNRYGKNARQ